MKLNKFGQTLRQERKRNSLNLRIAASKLDIDQSSLSKIERGEMIAPPYIVKLAAELFDLNYKSLQVTYLSEKVFDLFKSEDFAIDGIKKSLRLLKNSRLQSEFLESKEIKTIKEYFETQPIEKAWIFGSFATGKNHSNSDIDILVRFSENHNLDLLDYIGLNQDLEDLLKRKVDLVQEGKLLSEIEKSVKQEQILIYEK